MFYLFELLPVRLFLPSLPSIPVDLYNTIDIQDEDTTITTSQGQGIAYSSFFIL